jgi:hypothetical protein
MEAFKNSGKGVCPTRFPRRIMESWTGMTELPPVSRATQLADSPAVWLG